MRPRAVRNRRFFYRFPDVLCASTLFIVASSGTSAVRPIVPLYLADVRSSLRDTRPLCRSNVHAHETIMPIHTTRRLYPAAVCFLLLFPPFPVNRKRSLLPSVHRHLTHFIANRSTATRADLGRLRETLANARFVIRSFLRSFYGIGRDGHTYRSPFKIGSIRLRPVYDSSLLFIEIERSSVFR